MNKQGLKEQKINCFTEQANYIRNTERAKTDKLFDLKYRAPEYIKITNKKGEVIKVLNKKRTMFDNLARQQWRKTILKANKECNGDN